MYKDEYFCGFGRGEYHELKDAQKKLEAETSWENDVRGLEILPLPDPMTVEVTYTKPTNTIPKEVLLDTCDNMGLMISYNGKEACLRDCAMPSLLRTTGISGSAIGKSKKEDLAEGLTCFLRSCRSKSRILTRAGKVSAILSEHYEYMPGTELLKVCDELEHTFGVAEFASGAVSHALTTAEFEFPDSMPQITSAYNAVLARAGRTHSGTIMPIVQFRTSDTADEAAKLLTYLRTDTQHTIPLGGIKVKHTPPLEFDENENRVTCMAKFRQEAPLLFSKMVYDINDLLPKMLDTPIEHPGNTFIGLCKYANIPQKWGGIVEADLRMDWPDGSGCTFLDVYEAMTAVTALAVKDGYAKYSQRVLDLEEGISKVANNHAKWKSYDLPGTVSW